MNILKKIGTAIFATSYYITAIILGIIISIAIISFVGLKTYSNTIENYSQTQVAWNNLTEDIYSDIAICKKQITVLYSEIANLSQEEQETYSYKLNILTRRLEDLDNAMTYSEQFQIYPDLPDIVSTINNLTKKIENKSNFDVSFINNNPNLLTTYNNATLETNSSLDTPFGKIISNIFDLHYWSQLQIKY